MARIRAYVTVYQYDPKNPLRRIYLVKNAKNMLVANFWKWITNFIFNKADAIVGWEGNTYAPNPWYNQAIVCQVGNNGAYTGVYLGTDTSTKTTPSTYRLAKPIDCSHANCCATETGGYTSNNFYVSATWEAGVIKETIGEIGLVGRMCDSYGCDRVLLARCASADGAFEPFTPKPDLPLTVVYKIGYG